MKTKDIIIDTCLTLTIGVIILWMISIIVN